MTAPLGLSAVPQRALRTRWSEGAFRHGGPPFLPESFSAPNGRDPFPEQASIGCRVIRHE